MVNLVAPDFRDTPARRRGPSIYRRNDSVKKHIDVSIITPYYNTEELFVESFVVLQAQSLQNWEWIIVDDGSTDDKSVARLADVASKDERIKVIRQGNAGPSAARNHGVRNSVGRYLCMLDSDDLIEPTYLEKCVWFLDSNPEFAFCNSYSVVFGDKNFLHAAGFERGKVHLKANVGPPISVIRRDAYSDCGGFDESIRLGHEDWDFWLRMASAGHWGYTLQEFLQWYRKRDDGRYEQIMRSGSVNREFEALMHRKYEVLEKRFPEPARRHPMPYEAIGRNSRVSNPLLANPTGRRVMFLVPWMVTGGADRVNLELTKGLVGKGHEITVCATLLADHGWEHEFSRLTTDVFVLPNFLQPVDYPRFLAYLIESRQIDTVLISASTIGYQLLPYLRANFPEVAFLDMCHVEEPDWLNGGHPRFGVGYQEALDLNIVTTQHLSEWMQSRGADGSRIRVLYSGLEARDTGDHDAIRRRVRAELQIPPDLPVIVFAGRICAQKRPALLAEIFGAVSGRGLEFAALVVGDGELRDELEALLSRYSLSTKVRMLGTVAHGRWLEILTASDILLMPSKYEGISIALLEALGAGVVPVVAKVGGQDEIVTKQAGFLISHGDSELREYVDALDRLISEPERLREMSEECKSLSTSKLSWERTIDNCQTILDEAHQLRKAAPRLPISLGLGRELAALALENKRLAEAVDWLWQSNERMKSATVSAPPVPAMALGRLWIALGATKSGALLLRNQQLRAFARWLLAKLEERKPGC